jgi:hypothetical protein
MTEDPMVAALLREREGYVQLDMVAEVAKVDEQLRLRDVEPPAGDKTDPTKTSPRSTPPKARRARDTEKT